MEMQGVTIPFPVLLAINSETLIGTEGYRPMRKIARCPECDELEHGRQFAEERPGKMARWIWNFLGTDI